MATYTPQTCPVPRSRPIGSRPLRVVLVSETWPPEINGVAMTLQRWALGLRSAGHAVFAIGPRLSEPGTMDGWLSLPGLPIPGYSQLRFGLPLGRRIQRALCRWQVDVAYVATQGPMGYAAVRACHRLGVPVVSGFHTRFDQYMRHYGLPGTVALAWWWLRRFHRATHLTLAPDAVLCARLHDAGFGRVERLQRGVDCLRFHPRRRSPDLRARWGAGPNDPVALYVGRVAAEKNLPLFMRTVERMRELRPRLQAVVVGDGPLLPTLRRQFPWVHFEGRQYGEALAARYASADWFLFPSESETFGNVVLEAMASGLLVLAMDYAAAGQWIEPGRSGFLVPKGDGGAFIRRGLALAGTEPEFLQPVRARARQRVLSLDWQRVSARFEYLLRSVLPTGIGDLDGVEDVATW